MAHIIHIMLPFTILGPYYDGLLYSKANHLTQKSLRINISNIPLQLVERLESRFNSVLDIDRIDYDHPTEMSKTIYMMVHSNDEAFKPLKPALKRRELKPEFDPEFKKGAIHGLSIILNENRIIFNSQLYREEIKRHFTEIGVPYAENSVHLIVQNASSFSFYRSLYCDYRRENRDMRNMKLSEDLKDKLRKHSIDRITRKEKLTFGFTDDELKELLTSKEVEDNQRYEIFRDLQRREVDMCPNELLSIIEFHSYYPLVIEILIHYYSEGLHDWLEEVERISVDEKTREMASFLFDVREQVWSERKLRDKLRAFVGLEDG